LEVGRPARGRITTETAVERKTDSERRKPMSKKKERKVKTKERDAKTRVKKERKAPSKNTGEARTGGLERD